MTPDPFDWFPASTPPLAWIIHAIADLFASPCDEGIAFVVARGEGGASAAWIGHGQPHRI